MEVLSTGDIAVVGKSNSTNLNLGGGDLLASQGFSDGFVACYDNAGTYKWSFTVQGTDESTVTDVTETTQGIAVSVDFFNWLQKKMPELDNMQFIYDPTETFSVGSDFTVVLAEG